VADFNNWRVIDRNEMAPIIDAITHMDGYADVRQWFPNAVPTLSQYIVFPQSRMVHVRFKVANQEAAFNDVTLRKDQAYLGLDSDPAKAPKPKRTHLTVKESIPFPPSVSVGPFGMSINLVTLSVQNRNETTDALFFPHRCV